MSVCGRVVVAWESHGLFEFLLILLVHDCVVDLSFYFLFLEETHVNDLEFVNFDYIPYNERKIFVLRDSTVGDAVVLTISFSAFSIDLKVLIHCEQRITSSMWFTVFLRWWCFNLKKNVENVYSQMTNKAIHSYGTLLWKSNQFQYSFLRYCYIQNEA